MMWPFKWKLSAYTYTWRYLFVKILQIEIWKLGRNLPLAPFGSEMVNKEGIWNWQKTLALWILLFLTLVCVCLAALIVKWSPSGDSYAVAIGNKVVVYKLAVSIKKSVEYFQSNFILLNYE